MPPDHTRQYEHARAKDRMAAAGAWPTSLDDLPLFMTQADLARLLGLSERTLERNRQEDGAIPFRKIGRKILYARADVLAHLDRLSFQSTARSRSKKQR